MPNQICARLLKRISPYREREEEVQGSEETRGDLADRNGGHCWSLVDVCSRSKVVVVSALGEVERSARVETDILQRSNLEELCIGRTTETTSVR